MNESSPPHVATARLGARIHNTGRLTPLARSAVLALVLALPILATIAAGARGAAAPSIFGGLRWRMIGPFRGGRTVAAAGVPGHPGLFYIGVNDGGVWRSDDYGRTWNPIFDNQPTGSIGALAVAPSDPNVIYVGSGEGLQRPDLSVGNGMYCSRDAGHTWRHLGLSDAQQIADVTVDPRDARRVFVAVLGHPYGPNEERGVYRSLDGGESWQPVLHKDENTGAVQVLLDPLGSDTLFAVLWAARQPPWEGGGGSWVLPDNNGVYKSVDGGATWRKIEGGLPGGADSLGRVGLAYAPSHPARMYAVLGAKRGGGLYRSEDGGENWRRVNEDRRLWERDGDFNEVKVDPRDPDVVYVASVVSWKSTDGGRTFTAWRGAPGGDDYHRLWISPDDPRVILLAGDQGAVVTVNGGATWSSWYNQPTAQFFHVSTDDAFPYRVYGAQQESGSAGVLSRGNDGRITFREWHPAGAEEYGYVVPDPLHPGVIYGGKLSRYDWATGQVKDISPDPLRSTKYRLVRTMPVVFSPLDPSALYFAANVVFRTRDGGLTWETLSPDLTRAAYAVPPSAGAFATLEPTPGDRRGVVYALAPSPLRPGLLWAGTDDGLIHVTHDGGKVWRDVTPAALTPWSKVSILEASRYDTLTAYAAINRFRLDDLHPHIYRTRDGGATWREVTAGLPPDEVVNVVREDPVRRGLLYAGTEHGVHVSFDDGGHWESLRLNLPATSVRDLVVHDADLIIATHGRSFWVLDDIEPLRQRARMLAAAGPCLLAPHAAVRARWNTNTDTPLPPDEPAAANPPDGAILDYFLPHAVERPVRLQVSFGGDTLRSYSSEDPPDTLERDLDIPPGWVRPSPRLSTAAGAHRLVWDLHAVPPPVARHNYPIAAVEGETPREPRGPWVLPGRYAVRLIAGGQVFTESLTVLPDPRVSVSQAALARKWDLAVRLVALLRRVSVALAAVDADRAKLHADTLAADTLERELSRIAGRPAGGGRSDTRGQETFTRLSSEAVRLYESVESSDSEPTPPQVAATLTLEQAFEELRSRLNVLEDAVRRPAATR